jgi:hypothetical protein
MKDFIQYVEEMEGDMEQGDSMGRRIRQPKNMKVDRPRQPAYDGTDSFELISRLKKPEVQKAVAEILQAEPQTAQFLKDMLERALKYAANDHYNKPSFPRWRIGWSDSRSAADDFVGGNLESE